MTDRRPFTPVDDAYLMSAFAAGVPYRQMASYLRRSVASVQGRHRNLIRAETSRSERRMLCAGCYKGAGGGLDL